MHSTVAFVREGTPKYSPSEAGVIHRGDVKIHSIRRWRYTQQQGTSEHTPSEYCTRYGSTGHEIRNRETGPGWVSYLTVDAFYTITAV